MSSPTAAWADRLRRIARPVLAGTPLVSPATPDEKRRFVENFEDEEGHRRIWDGFLLGWMLGVKVEPVGEPWLWSWERLACEDRKAEGSAPPRAHPPHFALADAWTLEQETEKELAGLHAWWWLERTQANPPPNPLPPGGGLETAAAWVMANIQPDNATGHPWAIQVFLEHAAHDASARHYAETMLHNCMVHRGAPDRLSAIILLDAARGLDSLQPAPAPERTDGG